MRLLFISLLTTMSMMAIAQPHRMVGMTQDPAVTLQESGDMHDAKYQAPNDDNREMVWIPQRQQPVDLSGQLSLTGSQQEKKFRFYSQLQFYYASNPQLSNLSGLSGGVNLSMGIRFKQRFTAAVGAGALATVFIQSDVSAVTPHFPLFAELGYIGQKIGNTKFAPFANVQIGQVTSPVEDVPIKDRNENATYAAVKGGIAYGKFALFAGYASINLADKSIGSGFLTAGLGFIF